MVLVLRKQALWLLTLVLLPVLAYLGWELTRSGSVSADQTNFRVFVAGLGTVNGKWWGGTGVAVIGLETRPAAEDDQELKVIDILLANGSSEVKVINPDVTLLGPNGERCGLSAEELPPVAVNPGALSQGTVIISVPKGIPDKKWRLEFLDRNQKETLMLPLRVIKTES